MTEQEILEGNELIGIFMGGKWIKKKIGGKEVLRFYYTEVPFAFVKSVVNLNYHKNWDELMLVVDKIEELGYGVTIGMRSAIDIQTDEGYFNVRAGAIKPKIENLYTCIIQWIKWYNTITKI